MMRRDVDIDNQFGWDEGGLDMVHDYVSPYDKPALTPYRKPTPFRLETPSAHVAIPTPTPTPERQRVSADTLELRTQWRALKQSMRVGAKYCPKPGQPTLTAHQIWMAGLEAYEEIEGRMRGSISRACQNEPAMVREAKVRQFGMELQEHYVQIMLACEGTIEAMGVIPVACPWPEFVPPPI